MKQLLILLFVLLTPILVVADEYVVEFEAVDGVKKQVSSYSIPDGESPDTTNTYVLVTAQEYVLLGDSLKWEENTTNWLKTQSNIDKVDLAIINKPKTDKEIIADLTTRLETLEAKEVIP